MDSAQERHVTGVHREEDATDAREESDATVQLREEELTARKETIETGHVSVEKKVVEEQQTLELPVTHEEVTIERHAVDRRPSEAPISASSEALRVPVRAEQVSVTAEPVVYEEVNLGKRAVQETQRASDTVRKEVLDVDARGDVDVNERR